MQSLIEYAGLHRPKGYSDIARIFGMAVGIALRRWLFQCRAPWSLRRWAARWGGLHSWSMDPWLFMTSERSQVPGFLDAALPGQAVPIAAHFVATPIALPGGDATLHPLSPFFGSAAKADRECARLRAWYPACMALSVVLNLDPANKVDGQALERLRRQAIMD